MSSTPSPTSRLRPRVSRRTSGSTRSRAAHIRAGARRTGSCRSAPTTSSWSASWTARPPQASSFGRLVLEAGDGLVGWSIGTDDLDRVANRLGLEIVRGKRNRPDGVRLTWRAAGIEEAMRSRGALPFFIQWEGPGELHPGGDHRAPAASAGSRSRATRRSCATGSAAPSCRCGLRQRDPASRPPRSGIWCSFRNF